MSPQSCNYNNLYICKVNTIIPYQVNTNFWGSPDNNYGFGSSNISDAISRHPAMHTTPMPVEQTSVSEYQLPIRKQPQTPIPRYWESAADGEKVYDYVVQQEGNLRQPDQNLLDYTTSAIQGGVGLINDYRRLKPLNVTDKYKHAYMNCRAAQYGQGGEDIAESASNLREWNDKRTGKNTLDSSMGDQYANKTGRLLGKTYPEEDCDELVKKYIEKYW